MGKRVAVVSKTTLWDILTGPQARKFQTVLIGVALAAASQGLLPVDISTWVLMIIGVLTASGVYIVPNSPQKLTLEVPQSDPKALEQVADEVSSTPFVESPAKG